MMLRVPYGLEQPVGEAQAGITFRDAKSQTPRIGRNQTSGSIRRLAPGASLAASPPVGDAVFTIAGVDAPGAQPHFSERSLLRAIGSASPVRLARVLRTLLVDHPDGPICPDSRVTPAASQI